MPLAPLASVYRQPPSSLVEMSTFGAAAEVSVVSLDAHGRLVAAFRRGAPKVVADEFGAVTCLRILSVGTSVASWNPTVDGVPAPGQELSTANPRRRRTKGAPVEISSEVLAIAVAVIVIAVLRSPVPLHPQMACHQPRLAPRRSPTETK